MIRNAYYIENDPAVNRRTMRLSKHALASAARLLASEMPKSRP